jgi:hypothetical protein
MDALIIFSDKNEHPLGFLLNKQHRHVWCALRSGDFWIVYNWHQGLPVLDVTAGSFDLAGYYRGLKGIEVIETTQGKEPAHGPWICNNCTAHTLVICGIRKHSLYTPQQLWNYLKGNTMRDRIKRFFTAMCFVPGFGGNETVFVPAPTSAEATPNRRRPSTPIRRLIDQHRAALASGGKAARAAKKKAAGATAFASSTLLDDDDKETGVLS